MKTIFYSLLVLCLSGVLFTGCRKAKEQPSVNVIPAGVSFPGAGGEVLVTVTANGSWYVENNLSWLTEATKTSETQLKLVAAPNLGGSRNGSVICRLDEASRSISITQPALPASRLKDSLVLVSLHATTGGASWRNRWDFSRPMSEWSGVTVTDGRVTQLQLADNNLSGSLPSEISSLTALRFLDLHHNQLTGAIPGVVNQMSALEYFDLSENILSGTLPALTLSALKVLDISDNQFTGSLPLGQAAGLEYIGARNNKFSGALDNLSGLTKLNTFDISFNGFTGSIPSGWSSLTGLRIFYLHANQLSGILPVFIADYVALDSLAMDGNNFTGAVPAGIGDISTLRGLWLNANKLTGAVPQDLVSNPYWSAWEEHVIHQQDGDLTIPEGTPIQTRAAAKQINMPPKPPKPAFLY